MIKYYVTIMGIIIIAIVNSCSNDLFTYENSEVENIDIDSVLNNINYANYYVNPYDTVGKYHNKILDSCFLAISKSQSRGAAVHDDNMISNQLLQIMARNPFSDVQLPEISPIEIYNSVCRDSANESRSNSELNSYISQIYKTIEDAKPNTTPQDIIDKINLLEYDIAESGLNEIEKSYLLAVLSVSKYSFAYWNKEAWMRYETSQSRSVESLTRGESSMNQAMWLNNFQKQENYEQAWRADVEGAAQGMSVAVLTAYFTGPASVLATITGVVLSATVASLWEGVEVIFSN
ncbi:MAG: hypothetical protein E7071_01060 [Bacteroidales bacterium]|nr:hypothetical protein [Bacteroidales bacterium]